MEPFDYDEEKAIAFIRQNVGEEISAKYSDDDIIDVIDCIFDYYEINGLLDIDLDDDDDVIDVNDVVDYAKKMIRRDKLSRIDPNDVEPLVVAELKYEEECFN